MNRRLVTALILVFLFLTAAAPSLTVAGESSKDFNLNACYASCPCSRGLMDHGCAVCKQQCEWQNWRYLSQKQQQQKKGQ